MIKRLFIAILLCGALVGQAKDVKRPDSYNYNRGVEEAQNGNYKDALEYLSKEIRENADNGYAYFWRAGALIQLKAYGPALSAANTALNKIPASDKEYVSYCYSVRGMLRLCLEDTIAAIDDYTQAIKVDPKNIDNYEYRANVYNSAGKYELAIQDYDKILSFEENNIRALSFKAMNLNELERYDEAVKVFDRAIQVDVNDSRPYALRSDSYIALKQWDKAADDVIKALDIDASDYAYLNLQVLADSAYTMTVEKLKEQAQREPDEPYWDYCLALAHENNKAYSQAITCYKEAFKKDASDVIADRISSCYSDLNDNDHAMEYINIAIQLDSTDMDYVISRAFLFSNQKEYDKAIAIYDEVLAHDPSSVSAYSNRAQARGYKGDLEGQIEDYSTAIALIPDAPLLYTKRGVAYKSLGQDDKARADFLKAIELDEQYEPENRTCYYAHFYLGENDKAIEILNATLKTLDDENCYNAACLYSLMGNQDMALDYLEKALKLGQNAFYHMERDTDLDNIRNTQRYQTLIDEHKKRVQEQLDELNNNE